MCFTPRLATAASTRLATLGRGIPSTRRIGAAGGGSNSQARRKQTAPWDTDSTRPVPNATILPPLLRILEEEGIAREEIERADMARAQWFESMRYALPNGQVRAVSERRRVVSRHAASYRELQHLLALADLYSALAREYVRAVPPESLEFDPPRNDNPGLGIGPVIRQPGH